MSCKCPTGPMPARSRCAGEWIAPQHSTISLPRNSCSAPLTVALTPTQRVPSNSSSLTCVRVRDRQIGPLARLAIEIAHRRRDAVLVLVGMRDREIAVGELTVLVGQIWHPCGLAGLGHRMRMAGPVFPGNTAHRNAAVLAVIRAGEIEIVLDLLEIRQHVVPRPAGRAARFPFVVVGWRAAIGELAVDRGAAAEHARLLVFAKRRTLFRIVVADDLGRDLEIGPVEARIEIGLARIAVADLGRLLTGRRVLAGLAARRILLVLLAERRWASTDPADPPPTMMVSYTWRVSLCSFLVGES